MNDIIEPHSRLKLINAAYACISAFIFWFWGVESSVICFLLLNLLSLVGRESRRFSRLEELKEIPLSDQLSGARYRATIKTFCRGKLRENLAETIESMGQSQFFSLIMRGFALFLDRPWFSRMWVVQEASNAKKLIVLVGNYAIDWDRFCVIQMWAQARHHALSLGPDLYVSILGLELVAFSDVLGRCPSKAPTTYHACTFVAAFKQLMREIRSTR